MAVALATRATAVADLALLVLPVLPVIVRGVTVAVAQMRTVGRAGAVAEGITAVAVAVAVAVETTIPIADWGAAVEVAVAPTKVVT